MLPLKASALERLSLIGPFADQPLYQLGKYFGSTSAPVSTPKTALIKALPKAEVLFNAAHTKYHIQANVDKEVDACQVRADAAWPAPAQLARRECDVPAAVVGGSQRPQRCLAAPSPPALPPQSADVCVLVLGHRLSTKQSQFAKVQVIWEPLEVEGALPP